MAPSRRNVNEENMVGRRSCVVRPRRDSRGERIALGADDQPRGPVQGIVRAVSRQSAGADAVQDDAGRPHA